MALTFPLLRLPYLVIEKSIKLMGIEDQYTLSKVSNRSQRVVKFVLRKWKYDATFKIQEDRLTVDMLAFEDTQSFTLVALDDATDVHLSKDSIAQLTNTFPIKKLSLEFRARHEQLNFSIIRFVDFLGVPYDLGSSYSIIEMDTSLSRRILVHKYSFTQRTTTVWK